ncbi:hypothetical protein H4W30_007996 [Amycolatopsis roodepoortensis]|uniref:Uncharacterized protein n=1 Tax=Amycolatopsis roodepoortensis TaxID=700274 RepID=A0ABR9LKV3_9PSEU|nr:hypothetical protein [Amycolatopsis roodepoortensis]
MEQGGSAGDAKGTFGTLSVSKVPFATSGQRRRESTVD